jgi:hypothetical protein
MSAESKDSEPIGFAGLDSMVTDISRELESIEMKALELEDKAKAHKAASLAKEAKDTKEAGSPSPKRSRNKRWIWLAAGVVVVAFMLSVFGIKRDEYPPSVVAPPVPTIVDRKGVAPSEPSMSNEGATFEKLDGKANASERQGQNRSDSTTAQASSSGLVEVKPPTGSGMRFDDGQIRYCLSQNVRLDSIKEEVNKYSQLEIDNFNELVSDYNARCGNFKYRRGDMSRIKQEVAKRNPMLMAEGKRIVHSWRE